MDEKDPKEGQLPEATKPAPAAESIGLQRVIDVPLRLTVQIGATKLLLREVLQLGKGSVVELDRNTGEPADLFLNDRLIGRGEVVTQEDQLAVRIVELIESDFPGESE